MRYAFATTACLSALLLPAYASAATIRSLSMGMSGTDVTALQQALADKGYLSASATGYFGLVTLVAVKKFQCTSGIVCSGPSYGLVGPATRAALDLASARNSNFEISGWIPYWREATGTANVLPHLSTFTSLMPFGYIVQNDGSLNDVFGLNAPQSTTSATLLTAARAAGVKIVPTVMWSNGQAIQDILSDQSSRIALEDTIANLAQTNDFDGINIDFENKLAETKGYFSTFLRGLYERMGNKLVYCAIEARTPITDRYNGTPPPDATEYANDFVAINKYCDRVELMSYDQQTVDVPLNKAADGAPYIPVADPQWVTSVVNLAAQTIAKSKLEIGIATYGYEWTVTPLSQSGYRYDLDWAFDPRYATNLASAIGLTPDRNAAGELSFTYIPSAASAAAGGAAPPSSSESASGSGLVVSSTSYSDGVTTLPAGDVFNMLWWSDAQAIAQKVALAKSLGIRGVALFKLDGGEDPNMWSVLHK